MTCAEAVLRVVVVRLGSRVFWGVGPGAWGTEGGHIAGSGIERVMWGPISTIAVDLGHGQMSWSGRAVVHKLAMFDAKGIRWVFMMAAAGIMCVAAHQTWQAVTGPWSCHHGCYGPSWYRVVVHHLVRKYTDRV